MGKREKGSKEGNKEGRKEELKKRRDMEEIGKGGKIKEMRYKEGDEDPMKGERKNEKNEERKKGRKNEREERWSKGSKEVRKEGGIEVYKDKGDLKTNLV